MPDRWQRSSIREYRSSWMRGIKKVVCKLMKVKYSDAIADYLIGSKMRMEKKKKLCVIGVCLSVLMLGMTALAANNWNIIFCSTCAANLTVVGGKSDSWQTTHRPDARLVDGNANSYSSDCSVTHVATEVLKICPNGHGAQASATCYEEYHTNRGCGNNGYIVYYK